MKSPRLAKSTILYLGDLIYGIEWQINEPFFFLEIRHRRTNGNLGREFFLVSLKALCSEIYLCLYFDGHDQLTRIDNKVNLTGASVVGIVSYNYKKYNDF